MSRVTMMLRLMAVAVAAPTIAATAAAAQSGANLVVKSGAFADDATIPERFTCSGANKSPAITWSGAPPTTRSFAIITDDPDAPRGTFVHWVAFDIPATVTALAEDLPRTETIAGGGTQGDNGAGRIGYFGPCPPPGNVHHYHFRVFALDSTLGLKPGADADELRSAMNGHILASGELVGTYSR
jgi:Raf kinase inhibitor-like YbhB/YbcL family protein